MSDLSYGASLPDSQSFVDARSDSLISLLPTLSSFLSSVVSLERDHAKALSALSGKARQHASKDAEQRASERGGRDATVEVGWQRVLEQTDVDARKREAYADRLEKEVVAPLAAAGQRFEGVRKKHSAFASKLLAERDRAYSDRDKSRQRYYDACEALEQARQKKTGAKDDKAADKAERAYQHAMEDMLIAKNQYIIDTDTANVAKRRLYSRDLPAVHDDYQLLERSTVNALVALLVSMTDVQQQHLDELVQGVRTKLEAAQSINIEQDQQTFLTMHSGMKLGGWEAPPDLHFEECPVWHDTEEMSVTPASTVYLQNVKLKALTRLGEVQPAIETKRREIEGLRNLRDAYEKNRTLGDAGSVMENLFVSTHETTVLEISQTELTAQVELIDAALGDESYAALAPHDLKSSSFVKPETCSVCGSSVWGKGLSCRACGLACHAKCELKVPAGCTRRPGGGVVSRGHSRKTSKSVNATDSDASSLTRTMSQTSTVSSMNAPPRRNIPPPLAGGSPAMTAPVTEPTATLLYAYDAATAFELSVQASDVVRVVEPEDDAGWTKVRTRDGRVGLVPASYLQLGGDDGGSTTAFGGDNVPPTGNTATALYAYDAGTPDELSLQEGERVILTATGADAGDGWAEVSKNGSTGLVPLAYLSID